MRIVVCPDSFKGSLSSIEAADAIARGVTLGLAGRDASVVRLPLADGGEGTVDALVRAAGGEIRWVTVRDPLLRPVRSFFGLLGDGDTAVIEMAAASGLPLLSEDERDPRIASTHGTGDLIAAALDAGARKLVIGIGGSATNDGGAGAAAAMGARFLDAAGRDLPPGGAALADLARIDLSDFWFPAGQVSVEVACDVSNPLTGPEGASAVYGPQKGASPEAVAELDAALDNYAQVIEQSLYISIRNLPGGGAAGGLGAGLAAFFGARLRPGIEMVLDALDFDQLIEGADLIITGEGRLDAQTGFGKVISGVLARASRARVPVVAIAGSVEGDVEPLYEQGLTAAFSLAMGPITLEEALSRAPDLLERVSANAARLAAGGA